MEENKKEEVKVEEPKKSKIVPIIIIVLGLLLIGGGVAVKFLNKDAEKKEEKKEEVVDEHEVSEELLKKLVRIAFINNESNVTYSSPLDDVEGSISEQDLKKKVEIIVNYAVNNKLAEKASDADASKCPAGDGDCNVMTVENFKKALKLYGLDALEVNGEYPISLQDNKYYFRAKAQEVKYEDAMHNFFSMKMMDEIIINDNVHVMNINPENDQIDDILINKEYLFRKNGEKEDYYLYSVRDNSPKRDVE